MRRDEEAPRHAHDARVQMPAPGAGRTTRSSLARWEACVSHGYMLLVSLAGQGSGLSYAGVMVCRGHIRIARRWGWPSGLLCAYLRLFDTKLQG